MITEKALLQTNIPTIPLFHRGKVRDVYDLGDAFLIVATDRISAFDCVLPTGIPEKGKILTAISLFWFDFFAASVPHHLITTDSGAYSEKLVPYADQLEGRSMIVKKCDPFPVECIVRGYLAGSGWKEYQNKGTVCDMPLKGGLKESEQLDNPVFTPSTKAVSGHDENIPFSRVLDMLGKETASALKEMSLAIYTQAQDYAFSRDIVLCDTKFEFGAYDGQIVLIDEVLTPDSSRFWDKEMYRVGTSNESFDKQFVRDYLSGLTWDKTPPAPALPEDVVLGTRDKYMEAFCRLTGKNSID